MKIKRFSLISILAATLHSCSSGKIMLDIPQDIKSQQVEMIHVKGIKGKGLPGSKRTLKFNQTFSGVFKDGWKVSSDIYDKPPGGIFSAESTKRSLISNFGLDINDVISTTSDKYQFTIADSNNSAYVFCKQQYLGKSTSYSANKKVDFSIAKQQTSNFGATIFPAKNSEISEWHLEMGYVRETPGGVIATTVREGMAIEKGFITDKKDTIFIGPLLIKSGNPKEPGRPGVFEVVGGYEFKINNRTIGIVDLFNSYFSFFPETDANHKIVIASAATAILLRNR